MDKTFLWTDFFLDGHAPATMPFTTKDRVSSPPFEIHFREIERVAHDYKGEGRRNATKLEVLQSQVLPPLSVANATQTILLFRANFAAEVLKGTRTANASETSAARYTTRNDSSACSSQNRVQQNPRGRR